MKFSVHNPEMPLPPVKQRRSEQAYVMDAHKRLRRLGVPCKWEAALLGRSIDLVFVYEDAVHSVEFKLKDWRKGLKQARDHQLGADFAYLCLPGKNLTEQLSSEAREAGVGILFFQDDGDFPFAIAIQAEHSSSQWPVARDRLLTAMKA